MVILLSYLLYWLTGVLQHRFPRVWRLIDPKTPAANPPCPDCGRESERTSLNLLLCRPCGIFVDPNR